MCFHFVGMLIYVCLTIVLFALFRHWEDFPNGGPPQYQRAPTEYERPPPYYYPGAG